MKTIQELRDEMVALHAQATAIQEKADNDKRDITEEEQTQISAFLDTCDLKEQEIARRERLQKRQEAIDGPGERKTQPADVAPVAPKNGRPAPTPGIEGPRDKGTGGFRSFGEFAMLVHRACMKGTGFRNDPRLEVLNAASTYGQEAVGADGGYAVPPDFRTQIMEKVAAEDSLLGYTDQLVTSSNSVTVPVDENEPWSANGISVTWQGEGTTPTASKPLLGNVTVHTQKLMALVPVTDELLADGAQVESYIKNKVPAKIAYKINDAIVNGSGAGLPLGILKSNSLVTQAAEGGQTAATVNYANVTKMWSRMYAPCRKRAIWIITQDVEPQLFSMVVSGGSPALPAYLPPGGLSDRPYALLMGRPVVYTEAAQPVGTPGDIIFADPTQYLSVVKGGGVRTDVSVHLYFDQDATAFRFILRLGGQPWWKNSITRAKGGNTLSAFVALAQR